jgi:hypothetical protein
MRPLPEGRAVRPGYPAGLPGGSARQDRICPGRGWPHAEPASGTVRVTVDRSRDVFVPHATAGAAVIELGAGSDVGLLAAACLLWAAGQLKFRRNGSPSRHHHGARRGRGSQQPSSEEFLTVVCCALGKLCSSRMLSTCLCARSVTLASGQDLPTVVGKAFRQLPAFGTTSLQAALAPIIKCGNTDAWLMRAPAWSCRRTLPPLTPGRAVPCCGRGRFWPRDVHWVRATCRGERKLSVAGHGTFSRRRPCCRRAPHRARRCSPVRRGCPRPHA